MLMGIRAAHEPGESTRFRSVFAQITSVAYIFSVIALQIDPDAIDHIATQSPAETWRRGAQSIRYGLKLRRFRQCIHYTSKAWNLAFAVLRNVKLNCVVHREGVRQPYRETDESTAPRVNCATMPKCIDDIN